MVMINLRFSPCALAAQTCSLKTHPWPYHLLGAQQARRKRLKIAWLTWENAGDPVPCLPGGVARELRRGTKNFCWWSGVRQRLTAKRAISRRGARIHTCAATASCLPSLVSRDLRFGLRTCSKSLHHSAQFGTEWRCCDLATSACGIWVERPKGGLATSLPSLLWSQSFQRPRLLHIGNSSEPGGFRSTFHYISVRKLCVCGYIYVYSFFKILSMF